MNCNICFKCFKLDVPIDGGVGRLFARSGFKIQLDRCRFNSNGSELYGAELGLNDGSGGGEAKDTIRGSLTSDIDIGQCRRKTLAGIDGEISRPDSNINVRNFERLMANSLIELLE